MTARLAVKVSSSRHVISAAIVIAAAIAGTASETALASVNLKQVQVSGAGASSSSGASAEAGVQVDLLFDGKVSKDQIRTEFFNDVIQIVLNDVSVYPAKISTVNSGKLMKIFAYQYAPKVVRCRLTVKGKAETFAKDFKERLHFASNGKILTIRLDGGVGENAQVTAANQERVAEPDPEERALMDKVMSTSGEAVSAAKATKAASKSDSDKSKSHAQTQAHAQTRPESDTLVSSKAAVASSGSIAGGKPFRSPVRAFAKMALVLFVFGAIALGLRRMLRASSKGQTDGMLGAINRFAKKSLGNRAKMIEVISTHYLGPKKSIAVVKVAGRTLVLGVSNDAINLITQIQPGGEVDGSDLGDFEDLARETSIHQSAIQRGVATQPRVPAHQPLRANGGAISAGVPKFADHLFAERSRPMPGPGGGLAGAGSASMGSAQDKGAPVAERKGVRSLIKSKLEGLKQL